MGPYQTRIKKLCEGRNYTLKDLKTLALGLSKETGEVAEAVNQITSPHTRTSEKEINDLERELHDVLVYLCSLAIAADINLGI